MLIFQWCNPQKTDIVAEHGWLEDESLFGFRPTGANCSVQGGSAN